MAAGWHAWFTPVELAWDSVLSRGLFQYEDNFPGEGIPIMKIRKGHETILFYTIDSCYIVVIYGTMVHIAQLQW